ncbi:MAG: DUF4340 domain-containing protein, partial [Phycisphaeraceae bacterium]|nr:DUF4340 domain-containing protein [Phycisphaeraceae bacterium]
MNYKTTVLLLILVLTFGGYLWFIERGSETTWEHRQRQAQRDPDAGDPLFADAGSLAGRITELTITREGQPPATLTRRDDRWYQTTPVTWPMRDAAITSLAEAIAKLAVLQRFTTDDKETPGREEINLAPARAIVTARLADSDASPITLHLGDRTLGRRAYLATEEDGPVLVVSDTLHRLILDNKVSTWRQSALAGPAPSAVARVVLTQPDLTVIAERTDEYWQFAGDHTGRASDDAVTKLITTVEQGRVEEFIADGPEDLNVYGLASPTLTLQLEPTSDTPPTLLQIGAPVDLAGNASFATLTGPQIGGKAVFTVRKATVKALRRSVDELRSRRMTPLPATSVTKIHVSRDGAEDLHARREGDNWAFADPAPSFAADNQLLSRLVQIVTGTRAIDWIPDYQPDADPAITVELIAIGQPTPDRLRLYRDGDAHLVALRNNETIGYRIGIEATAELTRPRIAFRNRTVLAIEPDDIERLTLTRPDGVVHTLVRLDDEPAPLKLVDSDEEIPAERDAVEQLIQAVAPLTADRWQADTPPDSLPAGHAAVELTLADNTSHRVFIDPTRQTAWVNDGGHLFAISDRLTETITAELRDRTLVDVSRGLITTARRSGNPSVTLTQERGLVSVDGIDNPDPETPGAVIDVLSGLKV